MLHEILHEITDALDSLKALHPDQAAGLRARIDKACGADLEEPAEAAAGAPEGESPSGAAGV